MKKILEKYSVYKNGSIRITGKKYPMKTYSQNGYQMVQLMTEKGKKNYRVHRLVAEAYIPNPNNLPHINHKNGKRNDNRVVNLEWCTPKQNNEHAINRGTHSAIPLRKLDDTNRRMIRGLASEGFGATKIARTLGLPYYPVLNYMQGKNYLFDPIVNPHP